MKLRKTSTKEGAGSGCMARLVRFLDSLVAKAPSFIGVVGSGRTIENLRIYVDIIPHEVSNIMRHSFDDAAVNCRLVDDAVGYETSHDAILNAEQIGASILNDVIPQNLLLVFGQTLQSLDDALVEFPLPPESLDPIKPPTAESYQQKDNRGQKKNPKNCAVILCKLRKPESLLELRAAKKYEARHQSDCYKVTWCELHSLKDALYDSVGHGVSLSLANVKVHTPLPAGASDETGVKP